MAQITWESLFRPQFEPGGLAATTKATTSRLFDNFETGVANWTAALVDGAAITASTAANALKGESSLQIIPGAATFAIGGYVWRALDRNFFSYPVGRRIRYVSFRMTSSTSNDSIAVRLSDNAGLTDNAGIYRQWIFTLDASPTREMYFDLYSASAGYQNTEGNPGPAALLTANATNGTWNPTAINRISFRGLNASITYRLDDIQFYYDDYSLIDILGLGTEPSTDDGADGSIHSKLRYLSNIALQLLGTTEQYSKYGPSNVYLNNSYTFGLELQGLAEQGVPSTAEITPGNYTIDRIRDGATTNIVASTAATEAAGFISAAYTPLEDNWRAGDQLLVTFSGGFVDNDTDTAVIPTANIAIAATTVALTNAALFQAGQRVRIYDDATPNGERFTVSSIDSPTQITISAGTVAAFTAANNFRIVLIERDTLQTARLAANVTFETEISRELLTWTLADYDNFETADADGNTERWDSGYIANVDGSAAGTEGGSANINTTTAGQARIQVDPDATPTRAAYAIKRDTPSRSKYFQVSTDATVALNAASATSTLAGLRIAKGDPDSATNFIAIAREANSSPVNRITAIARFNNIAQTTQNFSTTDNAVAFKIERYENIWNCFYSLTQYPNWQWVKLAQFEDANGDMSAVTSPYLFAESGGSADVQTAIADFDNWKYYIGSGSIDQLLSNSILASGTFTTSSATVPADTGRIEANDFWNGTLLMPVTGTTAYQPRVIVSFANAGGIFTIDPEAIFTTAPAVGDEYVILAYQYGLEPGADATSNSASAHVVGSKADTAQYSGTSTNSSLMRLIRAVHRGEILASGTLTTDSSTVPADTGRTEVNNFWNGSWLMTTAGAVAFQPRLITGFANAGGVFTLDAQQPFTGAPGLSAYIILSPNSQLVPAADAATNTTPAHVIGNKSDAAAIGAGSASIVARLRAIEAALSVNAAGGGEFELDGIPDLWDALVTDSSGQADIITLTGNRDAGIIQRLAAFVNALQVTNAGTVTGFEEDGTGGALWESLIAVKGTFTTSSATVPADTGRTEANNYFNGDIIIPLSGIIVRQARVIVSFTNVGGVFTLDAQTPFTAAPGLVDYIILHNAYPLVPATDATTNTTSAHVIGNKTETIPAMSAAPAEGGATTSLVALTKAILERVGATPADPDDSVLTNIGQRDDAATADALTDITTTSIEAKLRRILLRFSADAFSSTVQGVARTDIENMITGLANYLSSAGAAWSVTANPGAAVRDNLEQTLEDFADLLAGTTGIVTFPARAQAANNVSLAEVVRHVSEAVGEDSADNVFASTLVTANADGSVLERLEDMNMIGHAGAVVSVTADFSSATWNTVATHEVFTVTGAVWIRIIPEITASLTSVGAPTIQMGNENSTLAYVGATTMANMTTNRLWLTTTPSQDHDYSGDSVSVIERVDNEWDIGYETLVAAFTGGTIVFRAYWRPLESGATVVAGLGGVL